MFDKNWLRVSVDDNNRVVIGCEQTEITFGYLDEKKVDDLSTIWDIFEDVHKVNDDAVTWQIKLIYTHLANCMPGVQIALQDILNKRKPKDNIGLCHALFKQIRPLKAKKDIK
ncbi:MAG: hypothetical protein J5598_00715 [Clostridia bacterium]|nr:hypothetical protein [Clostridia bacterium]